MEDTWHGGNFGKKDPQRFGYSVLMTNGESGKVDNRGLFHSLLSAIHRKAKIHNPKLAANYVLLPLAWTATCWKYTWRVLTKRRPWMKLGKDTKAAKQRRELFSRLKLFED